MDGNRLLCVCMENVSILILFLIQCFTSCLVRRLMGFYSEVCKILQNQMVNIWASDKTGIGFKHTANQKKNCYQNVFIGTIESAFANEKHEMEVLAIVQMERRKKRVKKREKSNETGWKEEKK